MRTVSKFRLLARLAVKLMSTIYLWPDSDAMPAVLITQSNAYLIDPKVDLIYLGTKTENYSHAVLLMASMYGFNVWIQDYAPKS